MSDEPINYDPSRCQTCGLNWADHDGISVTCAEVKRLRSERLTLARTYDPNCDEYDFAEQRDAMAGAASIVASVQELAKFFGRDPEMSCVNVCDEAAGEIIRLRAQIERMTASHPAEGE